MSDDVPLNVILFKAKVKLFRQNILKEKGPFRSLISTYILSHEKLPTFRGTAVLTDQTTFLVNNIR
jgi:hypothetical protein